ncbi:MAG TPA: DUF58 domain-containing protein [Acidimicrobiia bacterium]
MKVTPNIRLRAYLTGGLVGLAVGLAAGSPAPVIVGTALLVIAIVGIAGGRAQVVTVEILEWPQSMIEGEKRNVRIRLRSEGRAGRTYLDLGLSEGLTVESARGGRVLADNRLTVPGVDGTRDLLLVVDASGWGRHHVGPIVSYTDSPLGMFDSRNVSGGRRQWVVVPEEMALRRLLAPIETNLHAGDLVSRSRGPGSEFADLRNFRPGDDPRHINWRVSSRAGGLWVNERHPERNGDVLLLVDAQIESGTGLQVLVDRSVRLAAALLQGHARRRHRLGLVTLDGLCRWVGPGMGEMHRRRLIEQLLGVVPGEVVWDAVERAVVRAAKRPSMVIALTPLLDPNMGGLLNAVRRSGVDVSVIEMDATADLPEAEREERMLGRRLWQLERERLRDRLAAVGIPNAVWDPADRPEVPLHQLELWRMSWRRQLG